MFQNLDQLGDITNIDEPVMEDRGMASLPTNGGDIGLQTHAPRISPSQPTSGPLPRTPLQMSQPPHQIFCSKPQIPPKTSVPQLQTPRPISHQTSVPQANAPIKMSNPLSHTPFLSSRPQTNVPQQFSAPPFRPPPQPSSIPQDGSCKSDFDNIVKLPTTLSSAWPGLKTCLASKKVTKQGSTQNISKKKIKTHFPNKENEVVCEYCDRKFSVNTLMQLQRFI